MELSNSFRAGHGAVWPVAGKTPGRCCGHPCRRRELELAGLLVQGLGDREIAEQLEINCELELNYETARSRGKILRRKLGASSRAQVVAKALQLALARLGGR